MLSEKVVDVVTRGEFVLKVVDYSSLTDVELVAGCKAGDERAVAVLFDRYYPEVYRIITRMLGASQDIDDIVQNTMLEFHKSLNRFRGESKLSSWLYRICLNTGNMYLRKKMREPSISAKIEIDTLKSANNEASKTLIEKERKEKLWDVLHSLPKDKRDAFILAEMEELSSEEIAEVLDCTVSAVWGRVHKGRKIFWNKIKNHEYFKEDEDTD